MHKLDVQDLLSAARERTGLSDFGPADFMEGLLIIVDGINNEAQVRQSSLPQLRERFVRMLVNRLWMAKDIKQHPEILEQEVASPVFMSCLPRTGSTKLQRILGASGGFQTPTFWMTHMNARIPGLPDGGRARRLPETREFEKWMYEISPGMLLGHPMFTDEPEEDLWLLEATFRHPLHCGMYHLPTYGQWLAQTDMMPAFEYLHAQVQYLQWQFGTPPLKPWLSKTPSHFGCEPLLMKAFGKPRFIVTHRDPVKCIPSITMTSLSSRKIYSDFDSTSLLGPELLGMFSGGTNAHMQWRDQNPDAEILDLSFREITADGVAAVRKVYDFLGLEFTDQAAQGVRNWESKNPKDKHGKAIYSAASINSSDDEIREFFTAYRKRFAKYI